MSQEATVSPVEGASRELPLVQVVPHVRSGAPQAVYNKQLRMLVVLIATGHMAIYSN